MSETTIKVEADFDEAVVTIPVTLTIGEYEQTEYFEVPFKEYLAAIGREIREVSGQPVVQSAADDDDDEPEDEDDYEAEPNPWINLAARCPGAARAVEFGREEDDGDISLTGFSGRVSNHIIAYAMANGATHWRPQCST